MAFLFYGFALRRNRVMSNEPSTQPGPVQKFLWWLAGAVIRLLAQCPTDHRRYSAIGVAMVLVPSMAGFSAGYAVYETFYSLPVGVVAGCLWFLLVFNVDRLLLISIRKRKNEATKEFFMALPRLLMVVVLSILITEPLLQKLFEGEISNQLAIETSETATQARRSAENLISPEIKSLDDTDQRINDSLEERRRVREQKHAELMAEGDGTGGTLKPGRGKFYGEKNAAYQLAAREFDEAKNQAQETLKNNQNRRAALLAQVEKSVSEATAKKANAKGFLAKHSALMTIARESSSAGFLYFAIALALILLESTPLTIKLFSKRGHYDELLERCEQEGIYQEQKTLEETKSRLDLSHAGKLESSTLIQTLKKEQLNKAGDAIRRGEVSRLTGDDAEIATLLSSTVKGEVFSEIGNKPVEQRESPNNGSDDLPEKPVALLVHIHEPIEELLTVTFFQPEAQIGVPDLVYALRGQEDSLPPNAERRLLTDYQFKNDSGKKIETNQSLFSQLGDNRIVHLTLDTQNSSDATN
jgi:hypothetical protein